MGKAKSNPEACSGVSQVPYELIRRVGLIFKEGEAKYARDNWKQGASDKKYQEDRLEHAIRHLMLWANGDRKEDHLAKVAWFCGTQMELERIENEH